MIKIIFTLLIIACSANAADWIPIGQNADHELISVDNRSVKKKGSIVTLDVLVNKGGDSPYGSSRTVTSFDCKERKIRILSIDTYRQANGVGDRIESIDPGLEWGVIRPMSIGEKQWQFACAAKSPVTLQAPAQYLPSDPRTIFKVGTRLESDQLGQLMDKHFPGAKYRPNNTIVVTHQGQTFVIAVQKLNETGIPAIYKIVSVLPP